MHLIFIKCLFYLFPIQSFTATIILQRAQTIPYIEFATYLYLSLSHSQRAQMWVSVACFAFNFLQLCHTIEMMQFFNHEKWCVLCVCCTLLFSRPGRFIPPFREILYTIRNVHLSASKFYTIIIFMLSI